MLSLTIGNQVTFRSRYTFNSAYTNYAQGFLYNPVTGPTVAWSVASETVSNNGPIATFPFPIVEVNVGSAWNTTGIQTTT